jgi:hypothetical protein
MNQWSQKRTNVVQEQMTKSIPCHVVAVDKDFITVAFEPTNGIFTPPTVKIPQSMSQYAREPTQVGDRGYAVPSDYYLGGVTGDAGGKTNFYPRGNLTAISFQPVSHTQNPDRDYNTLTHMGGPNGWTVGAFQKQKPDQTQQDQQQQQQSPSLSQASLVQAVRTGNRISAMRAWVRPRRAVVTPFTTNGLTSSSSQSQQQDQQQQDPTSFSFDNTGKCSIVSKDNSHVITVDQQNNKITINVPTNHTVYVGGDGNSGKYAPLSTTKGPVINAKGRIG